jgi:acyl-CoA synthetase (NDP forming)
MGLVYVLKGIQVLEDNQIPNFIFPESAARGLAGLEHYSKWIHRERGNPVTFKVDKARAQGVFDRIRQSGRYEITEYEGLEVLEAYGFPVPKRGLATSSKEAYEIAKKIGKPVVMKIASPDILHKSDVGGVRLNIPTPEAAQKEYDDLIAKMKIKRPEARILGIFIAEMAEKGAREVILGIKKDPSFGPLLMFGFGGIFVEIFKDVAFRVAPIRESGAQKMIESIKSYKLLQGVRGEPPSDIGAIKEAILRLNQLAMDFAEIDELDINPLFVFSKGKGCLVVDVRILLTGNNHSQ